MDGELLLEEKEGEGRRVNAVADEPPKVRLRGWCTVRILATPPRCATLQ